MIRTLLLAGLLVATAAQAKHPWNYCATCPRDSHGRIQRSTSVRRDFLRLHGLTSTPPGCQVDHVKSLACGGSDTIGNLQLLCGDALRRKEATELNCR